MATLLRRLGLFEAPGNVSALERDSAKLLAVKGLHSVLRLTLCLSVLHLTVLVPLLVARKAVASASWAVMIAVSLTCMFLLRRGRVRLSSWIILSISWLVLALFILFSGGITSPALLSQTVVFAGSAVFLGRRPAIWMAAFSLAFGLSLAILAGNGVNPPTYFPLPPITVWLLAAALSLVMLPLADVNHALAVSVRQAQREALARRQDISERKKVEAALRESQERLMNAERLAHVGHWHWDLKSSKSIWSEECTRMFGRSRDYAPSIEMFLQAVAPQDRQIVEREVRHWLGEKRGTSMEFRIVRPDGDLRTVMSVSEVSVDEDGQPASVFGAFQDITDVRRAQEETVARQKLESLGTLAGGIAHDFNNLLGSVLAQAELALSDLAAGVNVEEELRAIRDIAVRGAEIVRELMIYAGKESAVEGLVDVSGIVKEMLELLKVSVSKHAVLETDLDEGLPAVRANAAQLRQIVMNLVTNASDAIGDRDGVIRVTTRSVKAGQKPPGVIADGPADCDYLELEVSDTGCCIPLEMQAKVFDPFFTTKSAGHGLGLAIVQGIVRSLGGAIHLRSEPGKGTTFQIWLMCAAAITAGANSSAIPLIEEAARPLRVATVLVVEDEGLLRQTVTKLLRRTGFEVLEATDGTSAINLLRANGAKIDLMLLDMTIPGASSADVVAEAARAQPAMKVILTSAYSQEMLALPLSAPQVCGFVRKPFQLESLVQALRKALTLAEH